MNDELHEQLSNGSVYVYNSESNELIGVIKNGDFSKIKNDKKEEVEL